MSALAKVEDNTDIVSQADGLLDVISRAARDPSVDIDKMERLIAMKERIDAQAAKTAFSKAMSAAQGEMRPIAADASNPQTRSKYASYSALDNAVRPIYGKYGFALSFNAPPGAPEDHIRVTCDAMHVDGHEKHYSVDMPCDGKGAKGNDVMTKTHATGAGLSYGQRYLLKLVFNLAVGEDKDGNAVMPAISVKQYNDLKKRITDVQADEPAFIQYLKSQRMLATDDLSDLDASAFNNAMSALNRKAK